VRAAVAGPGDVPRAGRRRRRDPARGVPPRGPRLGGARAPAGRREADARLVRPPRGRLTMAWVILIVLVVIFLTVIAPLMRQRSVVAARTRKLRGLQRERGTVVITIIHRQEQIGLFGVPLVRFIDIDDSEAVLRAIRLTPNDTPIDLVLHTPGGLVLAAEQIAHAVRDHPARVTVLVPHYAMSGGTLIALAADEIVMDAHAVLGPVDPQLGDMPAASILRVVANKEIGSIDDRFLVLAD